MRKGMDWEKEGRGDPDPRGARIGQTVLQTVAQKLKPGLVAMHDIQPSNGTGLFFTMLGSVHGFNLTVTEKKMASCQTQIVNINYPVSLPCTSVISVRVFQLVICCLYTYY